MRRLPIYVLLDCSESMIGTGLSSMQKGIETMVRTLQRDPHALETAWLSFITFNSGAELRSPLQPIEEVKAPRLRVRPGTALGAALLLLAERVIIELKRNAKGAKGDYRPIVVLITDGQPTDDWRMPLRELREAVPIGDFYAIGAGDDIDFAGLREVSDIVLNLQQTDEQSWAKLFVWITDTLGAASMGVAGDDAREAMLDRLPTSIEQIDPDQWNEPTPSDATPRQIFLLGVCGESRDAYLMRYRYDPDYEVYHPVAAHILDAETSDFGPRGGKLPSVDSSLVNGCPPCPHCGHTKAGSCGNCGTIFCGSARRDDGTATCPGCSSELTLREGGGESFKIKQSEG